ncbi:MAG: Plug domain-containing protein [Desulfobacterales bacterium]|nr:Plug domain-containing protein [Desulfobacterales bacterium]
MLRLIKYPAAILAGLLMITPKVFGSEEPGREQLEDLIVTAQKVEEDAMKIPVSVSVFSAKRLEDAGIGNVLEMTWFAPNVYMKKSTSENMITIRSQCWIFMTVSPV